MRSQTQLCVRYAPILRFPVSQCVLEEESYIICNFVSISILHNALTYIILNSSFSVTNEAFSYTYKIVKHIVRLGLEIKFRY